MKEEEKEKILKSLLKESNVKTSENVSKLFTDQQSRMLQTLLDAELDMHVFDEDNRKNGYVRRNVN